MRRELLMAHKAKFEVREAVARFFPVGAGYDHDKADRLISWLRRCGYAIVPRERVPLVPEAESLEPKLFEYGD
jgi:hypothetical protein